MNRLLATVAALACLGTGAHADCDPDCDVPLGTYHIVTPEAAGPYPLVVYLHGAGGRSANALRQRTRLVDRGYAVAAPQGLQRPGSRFGSTWSFHHQWETLRDEPAFIAQVIADAAARHGVDDTRVLITGFSIGGSMVHRLACDAPGTARAYAPIGGQFWRPHEALVSCEGPVDLLHAHGWRDGTFPIEGRAIRPGIEQGDLFYAMQRWRETNGCAQPNPDEKTTSGPFWARHWTSCERGSLGLALYDGGHTIPDAWDDLIADWFEGLE